MKEECFVSRQDLAAPRAEVFAFFADPANLEQLTPPWLGFEVLTPSPLPRGEGALFDYRIRLHGIPVRWRTLIERYEPGVCFTDRQLQGPYALWHHTHGFEDRAGGGTRILDRVRYRVGWGLIGRLATRVWVRRQVAGIFAYRAERLRTLFNECAEPSGR